MPRAILFDLDDTLIDHESAASAAAVEWAADHGIAAPNITERWATISERHYARYQRREITFTQQRRERVRSFLAVDVDDERADEFARQSLTTQYPPGADTASRHGFKPLPHRGVSISDALIDQLREEEPE